MRNPATLNSDEFNEFTAAIAQFDRSSWGDYWVQLRDGTLVRPVYRQTEHETEVTSFFTEDYKFCWNLDGTSVTRSDYDMMEIVRK